MTKRFRDWQSRLSDCVLARMNSPFAWGSQDCAMFASDCVLAVTGDDPAADLRGKYYDEKGAARIIKKAGGLGEIASARAGVEVAPLMAQPGDVGLVETDGRESLAVFSGAVWHATGADGLVPLPVDAAKRAWRVGGDE